MTDASHVHLDDDADAYALGALDDPGMARVDALVADCDSCARRLGHAEATVARMVVPLDPPVRALPRAHGMWLAVAAALVIGLLPSAYLANRMHDASTAHAVALDALVHSHFLHTPFVAIAPDAPHAKAIYARDGSWLYIVSDAPRGLTAIAEPGDRSLGTLAPSGSAASLYAATGGTPVRAIELRDGATVEARATLVTQK